jgi:hypothetical protein
MKKLTVEESVFFRVHGKRKTDLPYLKKMQHYNKNAAIVSIAVADQYYALLNSDE